MESTVAIDNELINNIKIGDLLFGREEERDPIRLVLIKKYTHNFWTIDNVNNAIIYKSMAEKTLMLEGDLSGLKIFARGFLEHLKEELDNSTKFKNIFEKAFLEQEEDDFIRYNCESAIRYIVRQSTCKIHFELGGIDFTQVAANIENPTYTTSELREIINLNNELDISAQIKFYVKGKLITLDKFLELVKDQSILPPTIATPAPTTTSKYNKRKLMEAPPPPTSPKRAKRNIQFEDESPKTEDKYSDVNDNNIDKTSLDFKF